MSYTLEEQKEHRAVIATELMRLKILMQIGKGSSYPALDLDDVNEILCVAGLPAITPNEVNVPELKVIKTKREDKE